MLLLNMQAFFVLCSSLRQVTLIGGKIRLSSINAFFFKPNFCFMTSITIWQVKKNPWIFSLPVLLCMCPHPLLSWRESSCSAESTSELTVLQPGRCLIRNILELLSVTQRSLFKDLQPSVVVFVCLCVCLRQRDEREGVCVCVILV